MFGTVDDWGLGCDEDDDEEGWPPLCCSICEKKERKKKRTRKKITKFKKKKKSESQKRTERMRRRCNIPWEERTGREIDERKGLAGSWWEERKEENFKKKKKRKEKKEKKKKLSLRGEKWCNDYNHPKILEILWKTKIEPKNLLENLGDHNWYQIKYREDQKAMRENALFVVEFRDFDLWS